MPKVKLFLYKARDANIVAILRRGTQRDEWQLIRWDVETDTFTEGQWLRHKHMNGAYAAISPCGTYFTYHYEVFHPSFESHGVVSRLPMFTALYHTPNFGSCWDSVGFFPDGSVYLSDTEHWKQVYTTNPEPELVVSPITKIRKDTVETLEHSGFISSETWTDYRGREIRVTESMLFANDVVILNTQSNMFKEVKSVTVTVKVL